EYRHNALICHAGLDPASSELTWIPTFVGMTCSGTTAQFAIIFEKGYKALEVAAALGIRN
ncbi:MAG: hypothetical protein ACP5LD_10305, partial [Desulfomonilaceae bacterium]